MNKGNNDIQRIISLSFEKIALERIQRGGVKLHKGLMLANVIYNAKHLSINQTKHYLLEISYPSSNDQKDIEPETELDEIIVKKQSTDTSFKFRSPIYIDKKANKRKNDEDLFGIHIENSSKKSKAHDDDSNYLTSSSSSLLNSFQMCHLNSPSKVDICDPSIDSSNDQTLQYTTLNTAQLCSEEDDDDEEEEEDELETSLYQVNEDSSSCSTQIREALDMLSRPVISLAV